MNLTLKVWRQKDARSEGRLVTYAASDVLPDMSFLGNAGRRQRGVDRQGRGTDCLRFRLPEGICGTCSMMINGLAHGGRRGTTVCQLHMRHFRDGDSIVIEPWRARAFPVLKDLVTDRNAFDRIIQAGGFVSVNTGGTPDANSLPIGKTDADTAMDAAACIGCGACVAAVQKCVRDAFCFREGVASRFAAARQG